MHRPRITPSSKSVRLLASAAVLSVLSFPRASLASEVFPGEVRDELDMPCLPTCLLCHTVNPGVALTAQQPFAAAMLTAADRSPPEAGEIAWVTAGLAGLTASGVDTDKDGMSDIDELKAGRDPNVTGEGDICAPDVRYGCGAAHVAATPPGSWNGAAWFVLGGLLIAGLVKARRTNHDRA